MPFGPFYSQEEKDKINAAQQRNYGYKPRPVRGDGKYTNKNKGRSGANQIDVTRRAQETVTPPPAPSAPKPRTGKGSFRDNYRGKVNPIPTRNSNDQGGGRIRGRSGAARGVVNPPKEVDPTKNPERPSQPTDFKPSGNVTRIGNMEYDNNDPALAAILKSEQQRQSAKGPFGGRDIRGGDGINPKSDPTKPERLGPNRSQVRTNANGVKQTGTVTGLSPMTLSDVQGEGGLFERLGLTGMQVQDPFSSNQLPTTGSSVYRGDSKTAAFETDTPQLNTGAKQQTLSKNLFESGGAVEFTQPEGDEEPINWANRTMADNSDPNLARRRAFLDAEDSLSGLRAVEAQQGIVYAGGQHNVLNPNRGQEGENDFFAIDKDDARGYKSGRLGARDLADKYIKNVSAGMESEPAVNDQYGFTTPETNMLTLKSGQQKLMSDMTEDDYEY